MTLREVMTGGPIAPWLLEERATIAQVTAQALAVGATDVDDTHDIVEVRAEILPLADRLGFNPFGMERAGTHLGVFEPDAPLERGWLVKAETGPEAGSHFRVVEMRKNRHHIELLLDYLADETADDLIGGLT